MAAFDTRETFPLGRVAVGLSDLLGGKSWPKNPHLMNAELQHQFDATELYQFAKRFGRTNSSTPVAIGAFLAFSVPENEAWYLEGISVFSNVIAGATLRVQAQYEEIGINVSGANIATYGPSSLLSGAGTVCAVGWSPNRWVGPGTRISATIVDATAIGAGQPTAITVTGCRVTL